MKKILLGIIAVMAMTACCNDKNNANCNNKCNATNTVVKAKASEVPAGVVKAIDYYIEGGRKASSEIAKKGFAETATMSWNENGKLQSVPIQVLFDVFDQAQPSEVTYDILSCHVAEDVAVVAIDSKFGETSYTDMFTLVKDGDDWKIISKIYHVKK